jgi:hypothetical protein
MKKLTRDRVVPIISAKVSCVISGMSGSGSLGNPNSAISDIEHEGNREGTFLPFC